MMRLSELCRIEPRKRRRLHDVLMRLRRDGARGMLGMAVRFGWRLLMRVVERIRENSIVLLDAIEERRRQPDPIIRQEPGDDAALDSRSVAIFIQFSPDGRLTAMVQRQLEIYRDCGFATVLVSNSPAFPDDAWQEARQRAALVVHRRNSGLDFGAWKDLLPVALARWPQMDELLLVNDSVLGPIRPLAPVLSAMREAGPGYFGLLESCQVVPHLQSWFTLARGRKAIADLADFLARLRLSRSKNKIIERGELRLAHSMLSAGNRVAAVYGYDALVELALSDMEQRAYLERAASPWFEGADDAAVRARFAAHPVNPSHTLWRVLAGPAECPFIKTELVRRNPTNLPEVGRWSELVPADAPCNAEVLKAHLAAMGP